jgi:hypothetical protein
MIGFPLLLIPLAVYNIIVFLMPGVSFADPLLTLTLVSGSGWQVTLSDILLTLGILLLLSEIIKGARPGAKYLTDHLLSLIVFGVAAAEFLLWPKFGGSTYFLLTLLALVDFLSGIALRTQRGAVVVAAPAASRDSARTIETPAIEPQFDPAPAPPAPEPVHPAPASSVPAAISIAESVLMDHPGPALAQPAVVPGQASPEVPSPQLQPGTGPSPDTPQR